MIMFHGVVRHLYGAGVWLMFLLDTASWTSVPQAVMLVDVCLVLGGYWFQTRITEQAVREEAWPAALSVLPFARNLQLVATVSAGHWLNAKCQHCTRHMHTHTYTQAHYATSSSGHALLKRSQANYSERSSQTAGKEHPHTSGEGTHAAPKNK